LELLIKYYENELINNDAELTIEEEEFFKKKNTKDNTSGSNL
jgi:hypothetical protein